MRSLVGARCVRGCLGGESLAAKHVYPTCIMAKNTQHVYTQAHDADEDADADADARSVHIQMRAVMAVWGVCVLNEHSLTHHGEW